jgi:hypothetical protein
MRTTISILFFVKRQKLNKDGEAPIYCRITINKERVEFSMNRSVLLTEWDTSAGRAKGKNNKINLLNDFLESTRTKIYSIQTDLQNRDQELSAAKVRNLYMGITQSEHTLIGLITYHNCKCRLN